MSSKWYSSETVQQITLENKSLINEFQNKQQKKEKNIDQDNSMNTGGELERKT